MQQIPLLSKKQSKFTSTDVITILGKRGSGKSTLCQKIQSAYPRIIIIDRLHEYGQKAGRSIVHSFDEFAGKLSESVGKSTFEIVFQFDIESTGHDEVFNEVMRLVYYRSSVCVVVEEIHNFATNHHLPHWLREIYLTGRHQKISVIATSQRPAEIHKTILSQSSHIYSGCIYEKNDCDYLRGFMGDAVSSLQNLEIGYFLQFCPSQQTKVIYNK